MTMMMIPCKCGCGRLRSAVDKRGRPREYLVGHGPNRHLFQKGNTLASVNILERHGNWKGGRYVRRDGYVRLTLGHSKMALGHVIVFEREMKCRMLPWGIVHHRNGTKADNRIENLEGMMTRDHRRLHATQRVRNCVHSWQPTPSNTKTPLVRCVHCGTFNTSLL